MANEEYNDNPNENEEEYHYTDDQPEYDLSDAKQPAEKPSGGSVVQNVRERFMKHRRIFLGAIAFLFLLGIVYRMLVPVTPTTVAPSITQTVPATPLAKKTLPQTTVASTPPAPPVTTAQTQPTLSANEKSLPTPQEDFVKQLTDRISSLEQQNAAVMNLLQTQFVQKINDADTQRSQMRNQMHELESHVDAMEAAFHQLTQLIQGSKGHVTQTKNNTLPTGISVAQAENAEQQPATTGYSVQAIIPGRAWLKSDSGDTVTVADGDTLKGVGKIVRIDPYDGIVSIDTGKKTITLTYGMAGDQA
ncbi:MAG: hypothetical protein SFW66_02840 [Gammaproteobacteria bacterium]|nr:hypothetical protein [Gammaproteobacteria bacterium]